MSFKIIFFYLLKISKNDAVEKLCLLNNIISYKQLDFSIF